MRSERGNAPAAAPERDQVDAPATLLEALPPLRADELTMLEAGTGGATTAPDAAESPSRAPVSLGRDRQATWFLIALGAATFLPWLVLPVFGTAHGTTTDDLRRLTYLAGPPHVLATFALFFDAGIRPLFAARRGRFAIAPVAILVTVPLVFALAPDRVAAVGLLVAGGWTAFHFARQNLGVLSFVCAARDAPSPSTGERRLLTAVGVVGSIGLVAYSDALDDAGLGWAGRPLGIVAAAGMALGLAVGLPALWSRRRNLLVAVFLLESLVFFAPIVLQSRAGLSPYPVAHGFQYLVFMAVLVTARPQGSTRLDRRLLVAALLITFAGGFVVLRMTASDQAVVVGLVVAISIVHFLMDASIWRLREPFQRSYVGARFRFLSR